jgi:hypothetical protein
VRKTAVTAKFPSCANISLGILSPATQGRLANKKRDFNKLANYARKLATQAPNPLLRRCGKAFVSFAMVGASICAGNISRATRLMGSVDKRWRGFFPTYLERWSNKSTDKLVSTVNMYRQNNYLNLAFLFDVWSKIVGSPGALRVRGYAPSWYHQQNHLKIQAIAERALLRMLDFLAKSSQQINRRLEHLISKKSR